MDLNYFLVDQIFVFSKYPLYKLSIRNIAKGYWWIDCHTRWWPLGFGTILKYNVFSKETKKKILDNGGYSRF